MKKRKLAPPLNKRGGKVCDDMLRKVGKKDTRNE